MNIKNMLERLCLVSSAALMMGTSARLIASPYVSIISIDFPGEELLVMDANNNRQTVGWHGNNIGFVRDVYGNFTTILYPGVSNSIAAGINDLGQITGYYFVGGAIRGFVRNPDGSFLPLDVPGSTQTTPYDINNLGQVTGFYQDVDGHSHGFIYNGSTFLLFDAPGTTNTQGVGISDSGNAVGSSAAGAFFRSSDGTFFPLTPPGCVNTPGFAVPSVGAISNLGAIGGGCFVGGGLYLGWLYKDGLYSSFQFDSAWFTEISGINELGDIAGSYHDEVGFHGYYAFATPEPATIALVAGGLLLMVIARKSGQLQ